MKANPKIYHEFAARVDNRTYKEAINLIKNWYPECKELDAWNPAKNVKYEKCTNQILTNSSTSIKQNIEDDRALLNTGSKNR